ncbi:MAG: hypothetical protein V2A58_12490 [Planctomycetota bacterium]
MRGSSAPPASASEKLSYYYDGLGSLTREINPDGSYKAHFYEGPGRMTRRERRDGSSALLS